MSTAIHAITESSDHYNFAVLQDLSTKEVIEYLKINLSDEYDFISELFVNLSDGTQIDIDIL